VVSNVVRSLPLPNKPPNTRPGASGDREEGALAPFTRAARAHVKLIATVTVVCVAACFAWLHVRSETYQASAQVLVTPLADSGNYTGLPVLNNSVDPTRVLQTAASIISSSQAGETAAKSAGVATSVTDRVTVEPQGESDVLSVTAKADTGDKAVKIANDYAKAALDIRHASLQRAVASSIKDLQARQAALGSTTSASATELASELTDLQRIQDGQDPNFSLLQPASEGTLSGASSKMLLALSLIAGLLIGLLAAVVIEYLNRQVRDEDELLAIYPLPILARVPPLPLSARSVTTPEMVPARVLEAFRTLQVQIEGDRPARRTVMFTSPSVADGKTTSAVNFSLTLVRAGARVVLLDLDLRKPDLSSRFGVESDLMELFRSDATLDDVLRPAPGAPGLRIMSAQVRHDVTPLLEAIQRRIPELIQRAHEVADYVVIDTAPLGEVSDALRIASVVDDVLLVVRPGHTDRSHLERTREILENTGHRPSGLVVVGDIDDRDIFTGYGDDVSLQLADPWDQHTEDPDSRLAGLKRAPSATERDAS
jgi:capsular exopolysaccharide synthesis family protein